MQRIFRLLIILVVFVKLFSAAPVLAAEPWIPYKGYSSVTQSMTYQDFTFKSGVKNSFGSNASYEHETQVYEKKFADYSNGRCFSNLPYYYRDTQACDSWPYASRSVDNFTVGSAKAEDIQEEKNIIPILS